MACLTCTWSYFWSCNACYAWCRSCAKTKWTLDTKIFICLPLLTVGLVTKQTLPDWWHFCGRTDLGTFHFRTWLCCEAVIHFSLGSMMQTMIKVSGFMKLQAECCVTCYPHKSGWGTSSFPHCRVNCQRHCDVRSQLFTCHECEQTAEWFFCTGSQTLCNTNISLVGRNWIKCLACCSVRDFKRFFSMRVFISFLKSIKYL